MRHLAGKQFAVKKNVILESQFAGPRWSGGELDLHFQPKVALIGLKLFRARVSKLRRRDQVLGDLGDLEFRARPAHLRKSGKTHEKKQNK